MILCVLWVYGYHFQKEKENLQKKIIVLEKQLVAKQDLESEIRNLNVIQKIEDRRRNLKEKEEELKYMESLNQTLVVQDQKSKIELQEARKDLIKVSVFITNFFSYQIYLCSSLSSIGDGKGFNLLVNYRKANSS